MRGEELKTNAKTHKKKKFGEEIENIRRAFLWFWVNAKTVSSGDQNKAKKERRSGRPEERNLSLRRTANYDVIAFFYIIDNQL